MANKAAQPSTGPCVQRRASIGGDAKHPNAGTGLSPLHFDETRRRSNPPPPCNKIASGHLAIWKGRAVHTLRETVNYQAFSICSPTKMKDPKTTHQSWLRSPPCQTCPGCNPSSFTLQQTILEVRTLCSKQPREILQLSGFRALEL